MNHIEMFDWPPRPPDYGAWYCLACGKSGAPLPNLQRMSCTRNPLRRVVARMRRYRHDKRRNQAYQRWSAIRERRGG